MDVAEIAREPEIEIHRWTADEFMGLIKAGFIPEPRHVELLDGIIIREMPPGDEHDFIYDALYLAFLAMDARTLGIIPMPRLVVRGKSVFEPDFARFRPGVIGRYGAKRETDILWAVEVSVSSVGKDLGPKKRAYAEAGVPDYWVFDEGRRGVWAFSNPIDGVYTEERFVPEGEAVALPGLDATLDTAGLFPPTDEGTRSV